MGQNYLDGSDFAMVFVRAEYGGAAVLQLLFWTRTPNISFIIDLEIMIHGRKNIFFQRENRYSSLNWLNHLC